MRDQVTIISISKTDILKYHSYNNVPINQLILCNNRIHFRARWPQHVPNDDLRAEKAFNSDLSKCRLPRWQSRHAFRQVVNYVTRKPKKRSSQKSCHPLERNLNSRNVQSGELRAEKAAISDRVICRNQDPTTDSCVAHYFNGKYRDKKWFHRDKIHGSQGWISRGVDEYAEVGFEGYSS